MRSGAPLGRGRVAPSAVGESGPRSLYLGSREFLFFLGVEVGVDGLQVLILRVQAPGIRSTPLLGDASPLVFAEIAHAVLGQTPVTDAPLPVAAGAYHPIAEAAKERRESLAVTRPYYGHCSVAMSSGVARTQRNPAEPAECRHHKACVGSKPATTLTIGWVTLISERSRNFSGRRALSMRTRSWSEYCWMWPASRPPW